MGGGNTVFIDSFPDSPLRHPRRDALVPIDVLLSSTTLVTAVARGRRAFAAPSLEEARRLAAEWPGGARVVAARDLEPIEGSAADGPSSLEELGSREPLVPFSPPGTRLLLEAGRAPEVLVACFRNLSATADYLARRCRDVALLGAGCREEFSCEDQMAAAWIAELLATRGFVPGDRRTAALIERWSAIDPKLAGWGNSAELLRRTGRSADLDFVLEHFDDLDLACRLQGREVVAASAARRRAAGAGAAAVVEAEAG